MIPVAKPIISKKALRYVQSSIKSGWVSSKGPYVARFEKAFAAYLKVKYAAAVNSGTSALHLGLLALSVGKGDEILVPSLSMIAACFPILYTGAKPVLVDVEPAHGTIDTHNLKKHLSKKTKGIIAVAHNGCPPQMDDLLAFAKENGLFVIEDAAEAFGSLYLTKKGWQYTGTMGDIGCYSFYGNKILTTGEGGMLVTNNKNLLETASNLRNFARSEGQHFIHNTIGYSYRMSSLNAALGLAQLEEISFALKRRNKIMDLYSTYLKDTSNVRLSKQQKNVKNGKWYFPILVEKERDKLADFLSRKGIETRKSVRPLNLQPAFLNLGLFKKQRFEISEWFFQKALYLPSGPDIKNDEIAFICKAIKSFFR